MKLTITIEMDTAAFGESANERHNEVAGILHRMYETTTDALFEAGALRKVLDSNGNTVGEWRVTK